MDLNSSSKVATIVGQLPENFNGTCCKPAEGLKALHYFEVLSLYLERGQSPFRRDRSI